jgi:pimeloyl-ACP methyl ester carboxylesterase
MAGDARGRNEHPVGSATEPVTGGGGMLHLVRSGEGPPVVLVHGVAGSHVVWDRLVPHLEKDHTAVRVDLMGYGSSPMLVDACTADVHVEAIRRTLRDAEIAPPYTLIGLSMGANLVLTYAQRWPEEVADLVGIGLPYFATEEAARRGLHHNLWTRLVIERPRLAAVALPISWWVLRRSGLARWHPGIYTPAMAADALRVDYRAFRSSVLSCMLHFSSAGALAQSGNRSRLFIHGSEDRWADSELVRRSLAPYASTRFEVIHGAPHNVVVTNAAQTADLLLGYLAAAGHGEDVEPRGGLRSTRP